MMLVLKLVITTRARDLGTLLHQNQLSVQHGQISHQNVGHHQKGYWEQNRSYDFLLFKT